VSRKWKNWYQNEVYEETKGADSTDKFYCPHAFSDGNIHITYKMLELSSTVLNRHCTAYLCWTLNSKKSIINFW